MSDSEAELLEDEDLNNVIQMQIQTWLIQDAERQSAEDDEELLGLAAGSMLLGAELDREARVARRAAHRGYLTRPELMRNPRYGTPWQRLYWSREDRAYITTMGFDVATFDKLLQEGFGEEWNTAVIPRTDTSITGKPRLGARSLNAAGALGLALHYLNSTMREISLQQIFALIPSTTSRYINFAVQILLNVLQKMPEGHIRWPTAAEMEEYSQIIGKRHPMLAKVINGRSSGAFGSIDGLKLLTQTPDDPEWENADYNGWLHEHVTNNVLAFDPKGK